jgi:hypothetical protein
MVVGFTTTYAISAYHPTWQKKMQLLMQKWQLIIRPIKIMFKPFWFSCSQRLLDYLAFHCCDYERTWWMLPLTLWIRILLELRVLDPTLCDKVLSVNCGRSVVFSRYSGLLKVALNSIAPLTRSKPIAIPRQTKSYFVYTTVYAAN